MNLDSLTEVVVDQFDKVVKTNGSLIFKIHINLTEINESIYEIHKRGTFRTDKNVKLFYR